MLYKLNMYMQTTVDKCLKLWFFFSFGWQTIKCCSTVVMVKTYFLGMHICGRDPKYFTWSQQVKTLFWCFYSQWSLKLCFLYNQTHNFSVTCFSEIFCSLIVVHKCYRFTKFKHQYFFILAKLSDINIYISNIKDIRINYVLLHH